MCHHYIESATTLSDIYQSIDIDLCLKQPQISGLHMRNKLTYAKQAYFLIYANCSTFKFIGGQALLGSSGFGAGTGSIHMDEVRCVGSESRLVDCSHTARHNCAHTEDVSIRCLTLGMYLKGSWMEKMYTTLN